jgi:ABC-type xylose transport system permease subunit
MGSGPNARIIQVSIQEKKWRYEMYVSIWAALAAGAVIVSAWGYWNWKRYPRA